MQMIRIWWDRSIGHCNENIKERERDRERKRVGFKVFMPNLTEHEIFIMIKVLYIMHFYIY